jgi:hypothetical protein
MAMNNKEMYLLFEGDEWLSNDSLVCMGLFTSNKQLEAAVTQLIRQRIEDNFDPRDYDYDITAEDWVKEQVVEFMESRQTSEGSVKFLAKQITPNKLEEI